MDKLSKIDEEQSSQGKISRFSSHRKKVQKRTGISNSFSRDLKSETNNNLSSITDTPEEKEPFMKHIDLFPRFMKLNSVCIGAQSPKPMLEQKSVE